MKILFHAGAKMVKGFRFGGSEGVKELEDKQWAWGQLFSAGKSSDFDVRGWSGGVSLLIFDTGI